MKPAAFDYFRPDSVGEVVDLLTRFDGEARVLAGGQSLVPLMNFRLAQPGCLIDVNDIGDLVYIREENGTLAIGAGVRQSAIEDSPLVEERCPLLTEATKLIGHRTIRNRGTIGGSIAHGDPTAEYPAVMVALDGQVKAVGPYGERLIPAEEFFITICTTALAPNELLTEVRLPALPPRTGWAFEELSRRHGDYAIVGAAAQVSLDENGLCADARIALAGVGHVPMRCRDAEDMLRWNAPTPELITEVSHQCSAAAEPQGDMHASPSYKRAMVGVFVERALNSALGRARRE